MTKNATRKNASVSVKAEQPTAQRKPEPKAIQKSKSQVVISLLSNPDGASLDDLCKDTGWQQNSARAFLTGLENRGYTVDSDKVAGVRRYRATAPAKANGE